MKLFVTTAAVLLSLSNAESNQARTLHLGSGRPGGGAGLESRLQNIVDQCPDFLSTSTCPESSDAIDCTFERPSKSNLQDMDRDVAQLKEEKKEKLKTCICCDIVSVEDIMDAKEEIMEAKEDGVGFEAGRTRSGGRLPKLKEKKCPGFLETFTCPANSDAVDCTLERPARPADEGELVFDDEMMNEFKAEREEFKEKLLECVCCDIVSSEDILAAKGDRPSGMLGGGGGGGGGGRPGKGDMDIQAVLDEKCTEFLDQGGCANVEERVEDEITCERFSFDSLAAGNTRGGRKGVMLYCGCGCRD